jgi:hypothetical protein
MSEQQPTTEIGTVGFLAEGGKLVAVRVEGPEDGKLLTRSVDGKERRINLRRLLWISEATVADLKGLSAHWEQTRRSAEGWDAEAAWRHLAAQGALAPSSPSALHARLPGPLNVGTVDSLVLAVFDEPTHFRMRSGEVQPLSQQAMEAAREEAIEAARRQAALEEAVAGLQQMLQGEAVDSALQTGVNDHLEILRQVALSGQDSEPQTLQACLKLLAALERGGQHDPRYLAFDTLVALGHFTEDENLALLREGMSKTFSEEVLEASVQSANADWSSEGRQDYTGLHTIAIDAPHTTEVDDAFAISGNRIVVFIADADALVPQGSPIDEEAFRRASTVYLERRPRERQPLGRPRSTCVGDVLSARRDGRIGRLQGRGGCLQARHTPLLYRDGRPVAGP